MYGICRKAARLREAQISAGLEVWHAVHAIRPEGSGSVWPKTEFNVAASRSRLHKRDRYRLPQFGCCGG